MNLSSIKKYTEGVLKQWFPTKRTILDKLGKDDNGYLTFDNEKVANFESVNCIKESILVSPITITVSSRDLATSFSGNLKQRIEDYAWAEVRCYWTTSDGTKYYHTHTIDTHSEGKSQWISQYWSSANGNIASNNGIVIGVQNKDFNVKFSDVDAGTITIYEVIGYKLREVTDGTSFAHEHSNQDTLNLISSNGDQLSFNGKPVNTTSYKKVLWQGQLYSTAAMGGKWNQTFSLDESALHYDMIVFDVFVTNSSSNYYSTEFVVNPSKDKNYWFSKFYSSSSSYNSNFTINSAGNIVFTNLGMNGFSSVGISKIIGIKYGTNS